METSDNIKKPTKEEQKSALISYKALMTSIDKIKDRYPEIEIEETHEKIRIPINALKLLARILKETSQGKPISIVPIATEMTTQAAAEILGCSRPHVVKLLEQGKIRFTKIGKHRRIKYEDVMNYKSQMKKEQERLIREIMDLDDETGLYDS